MMHIAIKYGKDHRRQRYAPLIRLKFSEMKESEADTYWRDFTGSLHRI